MGALPNSVVIPLPQSHHLDFPYLLRQLKPRCFPRSLSVVLFG